MKIQSVAVIDMGGFLAESAPVIKDGRGKDKRTFILLTFEQRERIGKWFISRDDYQWQGRFPEALPVGFENIEVRATNRWGNASNQWIDAHLLYDYLDKRYDKENVTIGGVLLFQLIKKAVEL